jgi:D-alanine-D-alanine ligase
MNPPTIAVLAGGVSAEREVSLRSGRAVALAAAASFPTILVQVDSAEIPALLHPALHVVHSTLHGTFGEDGAMQALLEAAGFDFAGCDAASSELTMDKQRTKVLAARAGVPVAPGRIFSADNKPAASELVREFGSEIVLKPNGEGSSVGLAFASTPAELEAALASIAAGEWLAEKRIRGTELTVGMLGGRALGVVEIAPKSGAYDYASKYTRGATEYHTPARIPADAFATVRELAETAFAACGCRDFARVDFMLSPEDGPLFLELNTLPGMTETSLLPKSASWSGYDFNSLVREMTVPAVGRFIQRHTTIAHV